VRISLLELTVESPPFIKEEALEEDLKLTWVWAAAATGVTGASF